MHRLIPVPDPSAVPAAYRDTPIERLLAYHNLGRAFPVYARPEILVATCVDDRRGLRLPAEFAMTVRTPGPSLADDHFRVAYAVGAVGVRALAVVAHAGCGMARVAEAEEAFVRGLHARAGWDEARARRYFADYAPRYAVRNEADAALAEADRLRAVYPALAVAALWSGGDHRLAVIAAG